MGRRGRGFDHGLPQGVSFYSGILLSQTLIFPNIPITCPKSRFLLLSETLKFYPQFLNSCQLSVRKIRIPLYIRQELS